MGASNFRVARITLLTNLKIDAWHQITHTQDDAWVLEFLVFGSPMGYECPVLSPVTANYASDVSHQQDLTAYISKVKEGTILSPFETPPFTPWCQASALLTTPKQDSDNW